MITSNEILSVLKEKSGISTFNNDKAFSKLIEKIEIETGQSAPSINTFKRLFNYFDSDKQHKPSRATLNIIAKYFECESWEEFEECFDYIQKQYHTINPRKGGFFNDRQMELIIEHMKPGTVLTVSYGLNSEIEIECIGKFQFRVMNAKNSDLRHNDEFFAFNFIKGDEFRASHIMRDKEYLGYYQAPGLQVISNVSKPQKIDINKILDFCYAA